MMSPENLSEKSNSGPIKTRKKKLSLEALDHEKTEKKEKDKKEKRKKKKKSSRHHTRDEVEPNILHLPVKREDLMDRVEKTSCQAGPCRQCVKYEKKMEQMEKKIALLKEKKTDLRARKVYKTNVTVTNLDTGETTIPDSTDEWCKWCLHPFETMPCYIPERYYKGKFYIFGNFCSFNCALKFNMVEMDDHKMWERCNLIKLMFRRMYDTTDDVHPAPDRGALRVLSGHLTIEEFRLDAQNCEKEYVSYIPPLVPVIPLIEEDYRDKNKCSYKSDKNIPINSSLVQSATENLRLKRSKPLIDDRNSLINSMGLRRIKN